MNIEIQITFDVYFKHDYLEFLHMHFPCIVCDNGPGIVKGPGEIGFLEYVRADCSDGAAFDLSVNVGGYCRDHWYYSVCKKKCGTCGICSIHNVTTK